MNTNPSSNVQKREKAVDEYGFPTDGDWGGLEAQAAKDLKTNKDEINKRPKGTNESYGYINQPVATDPYKCEICGKTWVVRSLARSCEQKHFDNDTEDQ